MRRPTVHGSCVNPPTKYMGLMLALVVTATMLPYANFAYILVRLAVEHTLYLHFMTLLCYSEVKVGQHSEYSMQICQPSALERDVLNCLS